MTAVVQGAYYVATGVWPLVGMRTFQRITGPKHDDWLVNTVGLLVTAVGASITTAALRERLSREVACVAVGAAAALTAVDVYYVARGRISGVYLADAIAELGLMAGWAAGWPPDVSHAATRHAGVEARGIGAPVPRAL